MTSLVKRPMVGRALFIINELGLVSVYESVESDKNGFDWFYMMSYIIRQILDLKKNISRRKVSVGVPDMASARDYVGTRTNQGFRIDYFKEKPYLHHLLGICREPILGY